MSKPHSPIADRRLHLGYRRAKLTADGPLGGVGKFFRGHEFHYARVVNESDDPLFDCESARGEPLGSAGLRKGRVMGSFVHLIDVEDDD